MKLAEDLKEKISQEPNPKSFSLPPQTAPNPRPLPGGFQNGDIQTENLSDSLNSKLGFIIIMPYIHSFLFFMIFVLIC